MNSSASRFGTSFSAFEDRKIVKFLCERNAFGLVRGNKIWQIMESAEICPERSFHSLRNRFLKSIMGRLGSDYGQTLKEYNVELPSFFEKTSRSNIAALPSISLIRRKATIPMPKECGIAGCEGVKHTAVTDHDGWTEGRSECRHPPPLETAEVPNQPAIQPPPTSTSEPANQNQPPSPTLSRPFPASRDDDSQGSCYPSQQWEVVLARMFPVDKHPELFRLPPAKKTPEKTQSSRPDQPSSLAVPRKVVPRDPCVEGQNPVSGREMEVNRSDDEMILSGKIQSALPYPSCNSTPDDVLPVANVSPILVSEEEDIIIDKGVMGKQKEATKNTLEKTQQSAPPLPKKPSTQVVPHKVFPRDLSWVEEQHAVCDYEMEVNLSDDITLSGKIRSDLPIPNPSCSSTPDDVLPIPHYLTSILISEEIGIPQKELTGQQKEVTESAYMPVDEVDLATPSPSSASAVENRRSSRGHWRTRRAFTRRNVGWSSSRKLLQKLHQISSIGRKLYIRNQLLKSIIENIQSEPTDDQRLELIYKISSRDVHLRNYLTRTVLGHNSSMSSA